MIYPLALGSTAFLTGCFLTITSEYLSSCILFALSLLILSVAIAIFFIKNKYNYAFTSLLCIVVLIASSVYTFRYMDKRYDYLESLYYDEVSVTGKVYKISLDYYIKAETINNEKPLFNTKFMINAFNDIRCSEGDKIEFTGKLLPYNEALYYGSYNAERYNFADNVYGYFNKVEYKVSECKKTIPLKLRNYIKTNIDKNYSGDTASLLKAILVGDKTDMSYELKDDLAKSGLSHIAVVSGMHVSIIISVIGMCFGFLKRKRFVFLSLMFVFFGLIVAVIGGHPSVIRAVFMAGYCIIAATLKKRYDPFTALVFSGCVMALYNPYCVGSISFILSFAATFALIIGGKKRGKNLLYITISVFIITLPICLFYFNRATLAIFFTNLLISPLMIAMLPVGYIATVLPVFNIFQNLLMYIMLLVVKTFASVKLFNITSAVPTLFLILGIYSFVVAFYCYTLYKKKGPAFAFCILSVVLIICHIINPVTPDGSVTVFADRDNVMHIKTETGKNILITSSPKKLYYYIGDNNLKSIDALVLTEYTADFEIDGIKKAYIPFVYDKKLKADYPVKYYENESFGMDDVIITPVSYMPYKSKVDEKRAVLLIETADKTILYEPYTNDELNEEHLSDINADIVVLKSNSNNFTNIKTAVGSGLQTDENVIYYDLGKCGSVQFVDNKINTLR